VHFLDSLALCALPLSKWQRNALRATQSARSLVSGSKALFATTHTAMRATLALVVAMHFHGGHA
jgi:hypothetical protein